MPVVGLLLFMLADLLVLCCQSECFLLCKLISWSSLNSFQVQSYGGIVGTHENIYVLAMA
jgi:hypothetical protein